MLDAAQGPMHPLARDTLRAALDVGWADPARRYAEARTARRLLDESREILADAMGVRPAELSFGPDGPAALRAALAGIGNARRRVGDAVVTSAIEHSSVLRSLAHHPPVTGAHRVVGVDGTGRIDVTQWDAAVRAPGSALAVFACANAEIGTRQPTEHLVAAARSAGVPTVLDRIASLGREDADHDRSDAAVMVGDARSFGGPPGVGLLAVRDTVRFRAPGPAIETEHGRIEHEPNVALVLAAAEAWGQHAIDRDAEAREERVVVDRIRAALHDIPDTEIVGHATDRMPHVLTASFLLADGESLVQVLDRHGIAVASGSACTSSTLEPSHVLAAMGRLTHGNIRITLPVRAVAPDRVAGVDRLLEVLPAAVREVRGALGSADL